MFHHDHIHRLPAAAMAVDPVVLPELGLCSLSGCPRRPSRTLEWRCASLDGVVEVVAKLVPVPAWVSAILMAPQRAAGFLFVLVAVFVVDALGSLWLSSNTWLRIAANRNCTLGNGCERHKRVRPVHIHTTSQIAQCMLVRGRAIPV